jgi:plasmid stabilization system protein ParE
VKLVWSVLAREELEAIKNHSIDTWGISVGRRYMSDIRDAAKLIARDPQRCRKLNEEFSLYRVRSHYLIVKPNAQDDLLMIARVLHVAMDLERHL